MSGFHPVASGSIPGIEFFLLLEFLAFLAQSAERCANNFSLSRIDFRLRNGRRFDPGRKLISLETFFFLKRLAGAMVARLPTEQEVVGSSPTSGFETKRILLCLVVNGKEEAIILGSRVRPPRWAFYRIKPG